LTGTVGDRTRLSAPNKTCKEYEPLRPGLGLDIQVPFRLSSLFGFIYQAAGSGGSVIKNPHIIIVVVFGFRN